MIKYGLRLDKCHNSLETQILNRILFYSPYCNFWFAEWRKRKLSVYICENKHNESNLIGVIMIKKIYDISLEMKFYFRPKIERNHGIG